MTDQHLTRSELLSSIDRAWADLNAAIDGMSTRQLTEPVDAAGWSAKDHIAHLAAWENSMVFLLQGKPRHEGLGVPETTYLQESEDSINDAIFHQVHFQSLDEVKRSLVDVHSEMLSILDRLTETELQQTYTHFLPDEPGTDDGSPIIDRVFGNTAHHFDLHRTYIERIVGSM